MASSSRPKASASSRVRVLAAAVMRLLRSQKRCSQRELEVRERLRDAELDLLVGGARHFARDEVAHGAGALGAHAGLADADAATVPRALAGALEPFEQRAAVADGALASRARQLHDVLARRAAAVGDGRDHRTGYEALVTQARRGARAGPHALDAIHQPRRSAQKGRARREVGDVGGEARLVEAAVGVV